MNPTFSFDDQTIYTVYPNNLWCVTHQLFRIMIIRAVSSSEEDSEDDGFLSSRGHEATNGSQSLGSHSGSVFDSPVVSVSSASVHGARLAWIFTALALVLLLLVDLSAFIGLLTDDTAANADAFAILPILIATTRQRAEGLLISVFISPAAAANNLTGFVAVAGWIYARETARQHHQGSVWLGFMPAWMAKGSPWTSIVAIACFGHLVSCIYVLGALLESNGDTRKFWLGLKPNQRTYPRV